MKKGILLFLGIMTIATVNAKDIKKSTNKIGVNYRYNDAISFVERGIKFHVFLDGNFDFNTHPTHDRYYDYNGRRFNNGVRIERDYDGRVRRVGNVFINYDYRGNVMRIGNVYMRYKFGQLSRVGNLKIKYDRWGNPLFRGNVKRHKRGYYYNENNFNDDYEYDEGDCEIEININIGNIFDYNDVYFYNREFTNNYRRYKEDDNFLYYRANPNANIGKRSKIIKRRKLSENKYLKPEQIGKSRRNNGRNR